MKSKLILDHLVIFEMSIFQLTSIPVNQEDSPTSSKIKGLVYKDTFIRTRFHAAGIIRTVVRQDDHQDQSCKSSQKPLVVSGIFSGRSKNPLVVSGFFSGKPLNH